MGALASTVWVAPLSSTCKGSGWFNRVYTLQFDFNFESTILVKSRISLDWAANKSFKDAAADSVWQQSTSFDDRFNALITHELLHVDDQKVFYEDFKKKLAKAEGAYCSEKECLAEANALKAQKLSEIIDKARASQDKRD